jgi:hypothetical protein
VSKRHQASRRRTYGRRQHEVHERPEQQTVDQLLEPDQREIGGERLVLLVAARRGTAGRTFGFPD